jgi:hypothetical protein
MQLIFSSDLLISSKSYSYGNSCREIPERMDNFGKFKKNMENKNLFCIGVYLITRVEKLQM